MIAYNWQQVPAETLPEEGQLLAVSLAGRAVTLLRRNGRLLAVAATCPHAGAPLCKGWLDALGRIVCPLHAYRFDPVNGRNTSGEGYKLRTYPVQEADGVVLVGLPD